MDLTKLGAREAAALIVEGRLTAVRLTEACLERIEARDGELRAWAHLDPEAALAQARACDARAPTGPLHGVPVGIKDIMDTADMPTEYGSPIYRDHRPATDAICVAKVRAAGGVVLGKTVSTEFAHRQPNIQTRNPHDPARTPGGSSSGSAAAVADFMVPLAFGTQTGGSIVRPASYCGVYGYKPTYDTIAAAGVKPLAPGLDTVGCFARNLDDIAWFGAALSSGEPVDIPAWPGAAPRVGLTRTYEWSQAEATTVEAVETAAARLDEAGARVTEFNRINYTIVGDAVNAAQRLETLGKIVDPDAESIVLLSPVIVEALPTGFQLMDRGTHMVKGKHKALQVYQLSHEA